MKQLTEQMQQANLSEKEQAVMEKILSNISNTVFLSGAQLAEYCDVSAPYITRLVRKLGYTKFSEFKEVLSERYRRATSPYDMFQSFSDESGITDVVKESLLQDIGNITAMEKLLDVSVLDRAVDAIDRCSTVYGVAMFASEVAIHMLEHYLWRLNKPFIEATGIGLSKKIEFSGIGSDDVLIAFSSQRVLKEVRDAAVTARLARHDSHCHHRQCGQPAGLRQRSGASRAGHRRLGRLYARGDTGHDQPDHQQPCPEKSGAGPQPPQPRGRQLQQPRAVLPVKNTRSDGPMPSDPFLYYMPKSRLALPPRILILSASLSGSCRMRRRSFCGSPHGQSVPNRIRSAPKACTMATKASSLSML